MLSALKESLRYGFQSPDRATRRAAWFFVLGAFGMALTLAVAVRHYVLLRHWKKATLSYAEKAELLAEQEENARIEQLEVKKKPPLFSLGQFNLELFDRPGVRRPPGLTNQATIEMVVRCDTPSTCHFVEAHLIQVRNEVTRLFNPVYREDLLSISGKRAFRDAIRESINRMLTREHFNGKVEELYFPTFIVS